MALHKRGKYRYGDSQHDIQAELSLYSHANGYPAVHYADAICVCGHKLFHLLLDDEQGAAVRICKHCAAQHPIADSSEYLEDAELDECECPCGFNTFQITAGIALYQDSADVRWLYIGCRCAQCGLTACYGDWKNEYNDFRELLRRI